MLYCRKQVVSLGVCILILSNLDFFKSTKNELIEKEPSSCYVNIEIELLSGF